MPFILQSLSCGVSKTPTCDRTFRFISQLNDVIEFEPRTIRIAPLSETTFYLYLFNIMPSSNLTDESRNALPMQVLFAVCILGVVAGIWSFPDSNEILDRMKVIGQKINERLIEKVKASLEKSMKGFNPEKRHARLIKLGEKWRELTRDQLDRLKANKQRIRSVRIEPRLLKEGNNLFEVNNLQGVSQYLFQGDINLTEEQLASIERQRIQDDRRTKRQASIIYPKWTNGTVYYYADSTINKRKRNSIAAALDYIQSRTCVNFIQNSTATNRIRVFNGAGCYSSVGMIGGEQTLSLGSGCEVIGTVAHEFTHALGFWHTQMRYDRDSHVTIDLSDVPRSMRFNFDKTTSNETTNYTPYEFGSFMHYDAMAFVSDGGKLSIIPNEADYTYTMGSSIISFYDIQMINEHYECTGLCSSNTSALCENGGVPNPRNCSLCNCPLGYSGDLCNEREAGFGTKIQVQITSMFNPQCTYGCSYNGIEIKTRDDKKITNPRICCSEFRNIIYESMLNPTPVISFNRYYYTTFTLQYRYVDSLTTPVPEPTSNPHLDQSECRNSKTDEICTNLAAQGFCTDVTNNSIDLIKYNCAKTCNLCGISKNPCNDTNSDCEKFKSAGQCNSGDKFLIEYHCADTCGYCQNPA
uniref:Metalloendopeptidase n=1 Tax=Heterorhabditis bacteriophora TaxID=37862 RepID=A0A1I7X098_HETBA